MKTKIGSLSLCLGVSAVITAGCTKAPVPSNRVVLYCSVDDVYARPIIRELEEETGLKIDALYDTEAAKTAGLANKIRAEKARPQGDVFWSSALLQTLLLEREGLLQPYVSPSAKGIPAAFKAKNGSWTGLGVRARVVVWDNLGGLVDTPPSGGKAVKVESRESTEDSESASSSNIIIAVVPYPNYVAPSQYPTTKKLQKAPWAGLGQIGISNPQFGTGSDWAAALAVRWGQQKTFDYFKSLSKNGVSVLPGNSVVAEKVARRLLKAGVTDTDDYFAQKSKATALFMVALNDPDTVFIPGSVAILKNAPHSENAKKLVDALLKVETEKRLVETMTGVIPTRPQIQVPQPELKALAKEMKNAPADTEKWPTAWGAIREPLAQILLGN